jgi:hypothetical protein
MMRRLPKRAECICTGVVLCVGSILVTLLALYMPQAVHADISINKRVSIEERVGSAFENALMHELDMRVLQSLQVYTCVL